MNAKPEICVFGAGSIGCYIGGRLAATGSRVSFVGRGSVLREVDEHGLRLTHWRGADLRVAPEDLRFRDTPQIAASADVVLVTVKSAATDAAGAQLADVLGPGAVVVSFQNGLPNAAVLRKRLPRQTVLTGMVGFNVVSRGGGAFHQGSEGTLEAEAHPALEPFVAAFEKAGLPLQLRDRMLPVQWAKLLLNLNNAINALSELPLKEELARHAYRRCLALAQTELLGLLEAAGIEVAQLTAIPPHKLPDFFSMSDADFRRLGSKLLEIDPLARSSMWEDVQAGRKTEIDYLNGEVVRLAASLDRDAPVNARLVSLIRELEQGGRRAWPGEQLLDELQRAAAQAQ